MPFTSAQLESFKDPVAYLKYRKELEGTFFRGFDAQLKNSEASKSARLNFLESMRRRVGSNEELLAKLEPPYPPNCRRLTPGPGYLEALTAPNLTLIQTPIERYGALWRYALLQVHSDVLQVYSHWYHNYRWDSS